MQTGQSCLMPEIFDRDASCVPAAPRRQLVLVDGRTFAISDEAGQMRAPTHGLVHDDLRHLSRLDVTIDGCELDVLASSAPTPLSAVIVARLRGGERSASSGVLTRRRWVAGGLREDVHVHNTTLHEQRWTLRIAMAADFAHVFEVKAGHAAEDHSPEVTGSGWAIATDGPGPAATRIDLSPSPDDIDDVSGVLMWRLVVPPRSERVVCVAVEPVVDGEAAGLAFPCGAAPADAIPLRRLERWRAQVPRVVSSDPRLSVVVDQALADLAALRIIDRAHPERVVIAAGAPWFMTVFGRDSLLTAWMALPFDASLARGVLRTLGELQGQIDDPVADEQPGKILHELRRHGAGGPFSSRSRYYGTVDATPLFVMLAAEAWRWGALTDGDLEALAPSVDAAVSWILEAVDANGDGFLDFQRQHPTGLTNQGWKDSWDGITFADGALPSGPIALAEVQGYAYAALLGGAELKEPMGLRAVPGDLVARAHHLRELFNERFWDPRGWFALALDGERRRVDSLTTNPGHALWSGIADDDLADQYLDRLMEPAMWTGWGLRTLADTMEAYDPLSYHNGSVWPHDTALCAAGAGRHQRWEVVERIAGGAFDAAVQFQGRPPELFAGIARAEAPMPVAYPSSCSPQAWATASVLLLVRALLDLRPAADRQHIEVGRTDLERVPDLRIERLVCGGHPVTVEIRDGSLVTAS